MAGRILNNATTTFRNIDTLVTNRNALNIRNARNSSISTDIHDMITITKSNINHPSLKKRRHPLNMNCSTDSKVNITNMIKSTTSNVDTKSGLFLTAGKVATPNKLLLI